ncbi:Rubrofusarin-specific efflux pump aurT [Fusarium oxysporum f. sp. albedinis]|nr:Rubrofusarin-specific efflux pump aurT [Fusarium oxysporum f. sp. albedinis]
MYSADQRASHGQTSTTMCTEVVNNFECHKCGKDHRTERDYKMCSKGRSKNKWGACGKSSVERHNIPETCPACVKKAKKSG